MAKKHTKKYVLSGLGMAAGSLAAAFGIRAGVRWWQQRRQQHYLQDDALRYARQGGMLFHPAEEAYRDPLLEQQRMAIPATGMETLSYPVPTAPVMSESPPPRAEREARAERAEKPSGKEPVLADQSFDMDSLTGPLIEYLIAFNSMMNVVRSQQEARSDTDQREMTLGDREGMRTVLEQVEDRLPHYAEGALKSGSLEERAYRLAVRIRDALRNLSNTDSDFLHLYDEVRPEACSIASAIQASGSVSITGLDQVRDMYECGGR